MTSPLQLGHAEQLETCMLLCAHCLAAEGNADMEAAEAVTVWHGDALCRFHLGELLGHGSGEIVRKVGRDV